MRRSRLRGGYGVESSASSSSTTITPSFVAANYRERGSSFILERRIRHTRQVGGIRNGIIHLFHT